MQVCRFAAALGTVAALTGCAAPAVREVRVAVPVPCLRDIPARPALPSAAIDAQAADTFELARAALADRRVLLAHVETLEVVLGACASASTP